MAGTATVYLKGGTDHLIIQKVRQFIAQPIEAPDWLDLRVGWLLSLTSATDPDTITGLAENIGASRQFLGWADRYRIGLTDSLTGTTFLGFTNRGFGDRETTSGQSQLVSSDGGIGTTNSNFWRPKLEGFDSAGYVLQITENDATRAHGAAGSEIHFAQDAGGAGGYATLLLLRLTRPDINSKTITLFCKTGAFSGDVLFTNSPTGDLLTANLLSFPSVVQQIGPVTLGNVPDTFFMYWPWYNSRLRISAMGFSKVTPS